MSSGAEGKWTRSSEDQAVAGIKLWTLGMLSTHTSSFHCFLAQQKKKSLLLGGPPLKVQAQPQLLRGAVWQGREAGSSASGLCQHWVLGRDQVDA